MKPKTKSFDIKSNIDTKRLQNLENENVNLRNKLNEYKNVLKQGENEVLNKIEIPLEEIKLYKNIRKINKDDISYIDLKNSILQLGQLQPVLLTSDNYLIVGYRRFTVLTELNKQMILVSKIDKTLNQIKDNLVFIQFAENEQRKNLDNFEIAEIFKEYILNKHTNKQIAKLFNKQETFVSSILSLNDIHNTLKEYLKEFQIYGYSYKKYIENKEEILKNTDKFYLKNKNTILGINSLYKLSLETGEKQIIKFLKLYSKRLSKSELESEFFKKALEKIKEVNLLNKDLKEKGLSFADNYLKRLSGRASDEFKETKKYKTIVSLLEKLKKELEET